MITIEEDVLGRTVPYGNNHFVADVTAFSTRQWLGIVRAVSEDLSTKATLRLADIQSE